MENRNSTKDYPSAQPEWLCCVNRQALIGNEGERRGDQGESESETFIAGVIVDSWIESAPPTDAGARLVLQVAPRGHPEILVVVEAEASLVSDRLWLEDLSENLCYGSPVLALGSPSCNGLFAATRLRLTR
jgi:hypothetical protein